MRRHCRKFHVNRSYLPNSTCSDCGQARFRLDSDSEFVAVNRAPGRDTVALYLTGPTSDREDMYRALKAFGAHHFPDSPLVATQDTWHREGTSKGVTVCVAFYLITPDHRYPHPNPERARTPSGTRKNPL